MEPGDFMGLLVVVVGLVSVIIYLSKRSFALRERKLDAEVSLAAEKAAQYAASNAELEARVRVLEQIVTDGGIHTAAQIEALRDRPKIAAVTKDDDAAA